MVIDLFFQFGWFFLLDFMFFSDYIGSSIMIFSFLLILAIKLSVLVFFDKLLEPLQHNFLDLECIIALFFLFL